MSQVPNPEQPWEPWEPWSPDQSPGTTPGPASSGLPAPGTAQPSGVAPQGSAQVPNLPPPQGSAQAPGFPPPQGSAQVPGFPPPQGFAQPPGWPSQPQPTPQAPGPQGQPTLRAEAYRVGVAPGGVPVRFAPPPVKQTPYPLTPQPHHHFWRAPRWRWWKSIVILLVGGGIFFLLQFAAIFVGAGIDSATGRVPWSQFQKQAASGTLATTPAVFLANNVSLDLLVPVAMLLAWAVTGQRPGWLASVTGRVRWGWLLRCMAWILPLWLVMAVVEYLASRSDPSNALHVTHDTLPLILGIVLTTPLQCAGEEFAFRGIINRGVAAWFPPEWLGFAAGGLANSLLFMLAHGAGDPWLNVFYFLFGMVGTWLARRTGGLEASIAVHVVNNVTAEWMLPFTNISGMFDRGAGTAGPGVLLNAALPLLAVGIIEWRARREHVVARWTPAGAPAASAPVVPPTPGQDWNPA